MGLTPQLLPIVERLRPGGSISPTKRCSLLPPSFSRSVWVSRSMWNLTRTSNSLSWRRLEGVYEVGKGPDVSRCPCRPYSDYRTTREQSDLGQNRIRNRFMDDEHKNDNSCQSIFTKGLFTDRIVLFGELSNLRFTEKEFISQLSLSTQRRIKSCLKNF